MLQTCRPERRAQFLHSAPSGAGMPGIRLTPGRSLRALPAEGKASARRSGAADAGTSFS